MRISGYIYHTQLEIRMFTNHPAFSFSLGEHKGANVIWIKFPNDNKLIAEVKKIKGTRWSATHKCWYISDSSKNRQLFNIQPASIGKQALLKIHPVNQPAFERFIQQMKLKALSPATIKTYSVEFAQLLYVLKSHPVDDLSTERLRSYFLYCIQKLQLKESTLNSRINAIKFYFEQVLHRESFFFDIPRPKPASQLPKVIDQRDIKKMLSVTTNIKHRVMLGLCYGMGLRVSEIVHIKIEHIDSKRMTVLIASSKGKKDRYVNLPETVLHDLRLYYKEYKPKTYLFEGQDGGMYSIRSVQAVFKNALQKAGIRKKIGIHSLRHSYATHLMEYGTDISLIQKLLGHKDIKTTQIYTHVSKAQVSRVKSPLDM
jgi:site-specific recombinase XerD